MNSPNFFLLDFIIKRLLLFFVRAVRFVLMAVGPCHVSYMYPLVSLPYISVGEPTLHRAVPVSIKS